MSFGGPTGDILATDHLPAWFNEDKRHQLEEFKAQCLKLSNTLLACFASQLGLARNFFEPFHGQKAPGNTLKLIKYPRFEASEQVDTPRLAEHTDWGTITFVFSRQGGLEVRDINDNWCPAPVIPGGIVVNIADALSLWTGKALKSTMHRITWENLPADRDRYSIAYFMNPHFGTCSSELTACLSKLTMPYRCFTGRSGYQYRKAERRSHIIRRILQDPHASHIWR
jgi:isopenicillin N synthase-like dioxygenase